MSSLERHDHVRPKRQPTYPCPGCGAPMDHPAPPLGAPEWALVGFGTILSLVMLIVFILRTTSLFGQFALGGLWLASFPWLLLSLWGRKRTWNEYLALKAEASRRGSSSQVVPPAGERAEP